MNGRGDRGHGGASRSGRREGRLRRREKIRGIKEEISGKRRERNRLARQTSAARLAGKGSEHQQLLRDLKGIKQELFQLERRLRAARQGDDTADPGTGALPDFAIIGAPKCGTTFLYHLLAKHPRIRPAAFKEPHFFDLFFDRGVDWYRGCFPTPGLGDGGRTITGEATPGYLSHPDAPGRMAQVVPDARLIALLRNPVDMIYSAYHFFRGRRGEDISGFEKYAGDALKKPNSKVLAGGIYVDQIARWSRHFDREQMLVLKSEDFFGEPRQTLGAVLEFLDLPPWEPDASDLGDKRNQGSYEKEMNPETRRRLAEFFGPHNQRLYEYLGTDFGW